MARAERPVKYNETLNMRMSTRMKDALDVYARKFDLDLADVVRDAITAYLRLGQE